MADKKISQLSSANPLTGSEEIPMSQSGTTVKTTAQAIANLAPLPYENFVFVNSLGDLPASSGGVIALEDNFTYFFTDIVDLLGNRIVCGQNTVLIGGSSENCGIKSTGLVATPLITSQWSLPIRNIQIQADVALNLNANGNANQAIDWFGVNFVDTPTVGTIANYNNFIMTDSALLNSSGLTFDGTFGTVGFAQCLFDSSAGGTAIIIPSTAVISRRFRIIYSSFVTLAGETSLNVSVFASIPVEGYILDTVNFSGGGTYNTGVQYDDNKSLFVECKGISNSASIANYFMQNNALVTDIVTQGVAVKVNGVTTAGSINQKFSHSNNRATYTGQITRIFRCTGVVTIEAAGSNKQMGLYFAKGEVVIPDSEMYASTGANNRVEGITIQTIVSLSQGDYLELWVENATDATDVTVTFLNVIIESLN